MSAPAAGRRTTRAGASLLALVVLVPVLVAGLLLGSSTSTSAAVPGWVAYTRDPTGSNPTSGDEELYLVRADGTQTTRLTNDTCSDLTPHASSDGAWLAWVQKCGARVDVVIAPLVQASTGAVTLGTVTNVTLPLGGAADRWPQFSPDGTKLAFMRASGGNFDIYRGDLTLAPGRAPVLSNVRRVVRLGSGDVEDCCVTWSPDGRHLVWASNVNRTQQSFNLYRVPSTTTDLFDAQTNVDGSADGTRDVTVAEQLTSGSQYEGTPAYDANGTVLFRCNCPGADVYRLDPVTRVRTRVTTYAGLDRTPEGFPGGILYSRGDKVGSDEVYVASSTGTGPVNLTNDPASDVDPTWVAPPP